MKIRYMIIVILLTSLMLDYVCGPFHVADTVDTILLFFTLDIYDYLLYFCVPCDLPEIFPSRRSVGVIMTRNYRKMVIVMYRRNEMTEVM